VSAAVIGVLDALPVPVAVIGPDSTLLTANPAWRQLGLDATFPASAQDGIRRVLAGETKQFTFELRRCDPAAWHRITVTRADDGTAVLTAADISEQTLSTATQRTQLAQLSAIYDAIDIGVVVIEVDADGGYRFAAANARTAALTGIRDVEFTDRRIDELAPPDSARRIIAHCDEAIRTGHPVRWSAVTRYRAGKIHADVTVVPIIDADGHCRQLLATVRDKTDLAVRDEVLHELEEHSARQFRSFHTAVAAISDFVYMFDRDCRFTYGSQRLLDLLQVTDEELVARPLEELGYPDDIAAMLRAQIAEVFATGQTMRGETPFTSPGGVTAVYEYRFHPVFGEGGRVDLVAGMSRDITERRATEEALRRNAEEQRALAEKLALERQRLNEAQSVAKIGSWILDHATGAITWSEESYRIFELPLDTPLTYDTWYWRVHPDDRERADAEYRRAVAERRPHLHEHRLLLPDGRVKWTQARCEIYYDADGNPSLAVGTVQDITERKVAEIALHQSQQLLRIATRVGQLGGWDIDLATSTVSWTDEVCAIHGVPPGFRPTVEQALAFYTPESIDTIRDAVNECIERGTPFDIELQIINTQGERVWVRSIGEAERDEAGHVAGVRGAFQNISERKKALDALRASDERFRLIAHATTDVIWDWDIATDVCWWSEGLITQLGYDDPGPHPAQFWLDNIHPEDRERVERGFMSVLNAGQLWSDEYRFRKADGTYIHVTDRAFVARDADGRAYRMLGALVDITQQRALEAQLEQIKRVSSLGQLAANMAHEFNNVLMSIQPFTELIRRSVPNDTRVEHAVSMMQQAVQRGRKVTDEILRFTRGVAPVKKAIVVREWLEGFRAEAEALLNGHLTFDLAIDDASLHVLGDVAQLNQVLANIVINSRDATPAGGRVSVRAERCTNERFGCSPDSEYVHVCIRDNGPGIAPDAMERLFDPLFTTKRTGTGLGLAICHQVVTAHGGRIIAESEPGAGATFHLILPGTAPLASVEHAAGASASTLPKRVLIVEDEVNVANGLAAALELEDVETAVVNEGGAAIESIRRFDPEVVLLDVALPDVSGVDVFHQILAEWPSRKVVFMTGHLSRAELDALLARPHVGFLQKPFSMDDLCNVLSAVGGEAR
jgi:PAS domain S-box-containing protein